MGVGVNLVVSESVASKQNLHRSDYLDKGGSKQAKIFSSIYVQSGWYCFQEKSVDSKLKCYNQI